MAGIRKSDNASLSRGRSRMWSNVHDLFYVRNMFYSQIGVVVCGNGSAAPSGKRAKNPKKTNASPRARRKSWEVSQREAGYLYKIYTADPSPFSNYFVAYRWTT